MIKKFLLVKKLFAVHTECLPGPEVMEHYSNTRGIKIVHQIIRGLFRKYWATSKTWNCTLKNLDPEKPVS